MKKLYLSILFLLAGVGSVFSQDVEQAVRERLQAFFQTYIPGNVNIGTCRLDSVRIDFHRKTIRIYADNTFSYQPFRPETVNRIYRDINSSGSSNLLRHYCLYRRTFHQRTYSQHIQKRKKRQEPPVYRYTL